ncbi:carbohydrate ABC transporter permease [Cohnella nanjingensis]|uniref:Carbohydrate ABC transporter permease n=1 Tax=Cohnella nanjingensis TaxID=1387779 RepID=A0A7X0VDM7_9BACL|nr:carbohydrate ABC transporter permease [Cohnella nanjingensis]MBB6670120.1 carbohydrate ABC transporter permease [Cohnella nanjingensis]
MFKRSTGDKIFDTFLYTFLILLSLAFLYPFWKVLVMAFNEANDTSLGGALLWPRKFTLQNFKVVLQNHQIYSSYLITISRTVLGTATTVIATALFAYGLSKKKLMFRNFYLTLCFITLFFSGGLIPSVINMRDLGLANNFLVYIVPAMYGVMAMIIMKSFFNSLPASLEESAMIDGANDFVIFFKIVFPSSMPVIATIALMSAVGQWNAWIDAYIFISKESLMPVQLLLQRVIQSSNAASEIVKIVPNDEILSRRVTPYSLQLATLVVAIGPIILIYPFFQRFFVKGFLIGAVKE